MRRAGEKTAGESPGRLAGGAAVVELAGERREGSPGSASLTGGAQQAAGEDLKAGVLGVGEKEQFLRGFSKACLIMAVEGLCSRWLEEAWVRSV
jgi:hypothetical protein